MGITLGVVLMVLFLVSFGLLLPGYCAYEVTNERAQRVVVRIAKRAGWLFQIMYINAGPTHQAVLSCGMVFMYIDGRKADPYAYIAQPPIAQPPSGNAPSFAVLNPLRYANWAIQEFKKSGFADARVAYADTKGSLYVIDFKLQNPKILNKFS